MSGLEQRTKGRDEAPGDWTPIEGDLLDERRAAVPAFPLDLLAPPWRDWVGGAACAADAPVDYVAQALLATVAGVSGPGVWVVVTRDWIEPLQLWLAAVGAPSTGKSPALLSVRRLLNALEQEPREGLEGPPRRIVLDRHRAEDVAQALARRKHGALLWRDGAAGCFTPLKGMDSARQLEDLSVSILGSIEPDGVAPALQRGGGGLAARFLYAWPHPTPFRPLDDRQRADYDDVLASMWRLLRYGAGERCILMLDAAGGRAFNAFLERLHKEVRQAEGLEAAWLGKGRGAVACLSALFALMAWSSSESAEPPLNIDADAVERAVSLWSDYYRPHARAFLLNAVPTDVENQARRVVRWLRADGRATVSRTDLRCSALGHAVDARGAERVASRLMEAGVLRRMASEASPRRGRPALRWHVNPLLAAA